MKKHSQDLDLVFEAIRSLRRNGARVHSITNTVVQDFTANTLLACGASPSMTINPVEIADFTESCDALHINLGTLDAVRMDAIKASHKVAIERQLPVVLDPVKVHKSPYRLEFAKSVIDAGVNILKVNSAENSVLEEFYGKVECRVLTGAVDKIETSDEAISIENGDPLMSKIVGTGCVLGALLAALSVHANSSKIAAIAALGWFSIAGEIAAEKASGPGSFKPLFLDTLHSLSVDQIRDRLLIK